MPTDTQWVRIGTVLSANPARRQIRLDIAGSYAPMLEGLVWVHTRFRDGSVLKSKVEKMQTTGPNPIVTLVPGVPRDTVARMTKADVVIEDDGVVRSSDEYDLGELEGLEVVDANGTSLGRIESAFETPAHGIMEVQDAAGRSLLIPVIPEVVKDIDWDERRMQVGDIAGFASGLDDEDDEPVSGVDT